MQNLTDLFASGLLFEGVRLSHFQNNMQVELRLTEHDMLHNTDLRERVIRILESNLTHFLAKKVKKKLKEKVLQALVYLSELVSPELNTENLQKHDTIPYHELRIPKAKDLINSEFSSSTQSFHGSPSKTKRASWSNKTQKLNLSGVSPPSYSSSGTKRKFNSVREYKEFVDHQKTPSEQEQTLRRLSKCEMLTTKVSTPSSSPNQARSPKFLSDHEQDQKHDGNQSRQFTFDQNDFSPFYQGNLSKITEVSQSDFSHNNAKSVNSQVPPYKRINMEEVKTFGGLLSHSPLKTQDLTRDLQYALSMLSGSGGVTFLEDQSLSQLMPLSDCPDSERKDNISDFSDTVRKASTHSIFPQVKSLEKTVSMQDIKKSSKSLIFPKISERTKQLILVGKRMARFCRKCMYISAWEKWVIFNLESRRQEIRRMSSNLKKAEQYYKDMLTTKAFTSLCIESGQENGVLRAQLHSQKLLKRRALKAMFKKMEKGERKLELAKLREQWELNKYISVGFTHWRNLLSFRRERQKLLRTFVFRVYLRKLSRSFNFMKYLAYEAMWAKTQRQAIYSLQDSVRKRKEEQPSIINEIDEYFARSDLSIDSSPFPTRGYIRKNCAFQISNQTRKELNSIVSEAYSVLPGNHGSSISRKCSVESSIRLEKRPGAIVPIESEKPNRKCQGLVRRLKQLNDELKHEQHKQKKLQRMKRVVKNQGSLVPRSVMSTFFPRDLR